jgi:hypothetical protein
MRSWGCVARSLIARLQVCDPELVVTVGVLFWFPSASASSAGSLSTSSRASDSWDSCSSASATLDAGELTITLQKGSNEFYCSVDGHKDKGMDVTVQVT